MARRAKASREPEPEPEPASEPAPPAPLGFEKWMGFLSHFIAPSALITALLFYFGYVSSRTFFLYFGVDVDVLGLSTQQFVMRSPGALFIPVMILLLIAAGLIVGHRLLRRRVTRQTPERQRRTIAVFAWTGIVLIVVGLVLAFSYALLVAWAPYAFVTSASLAVGAGLAAYAASTARVLSGGTQGRSVVVLLVAVMVAGTFWATATVAEWWGRGQARILAADLESLPAVVLDTKERILPRDDTVSVASLPPTPGVEAPFVFRYYGLRLLVRGGDNLFLVPDEWSEAASTFVVPIGDETRVRFRFFPDADPPR